MTKKRRLLGMFATQLAMSAAVYLMTAFVKWDPAWYAEVAHYQPSDRVGMLLVWGFMVAINSILWTAS